MQQVYLTVKETAARLGCNRTTVIVLIERGELPALDMCVVGQQNRQFRIHPNDLEALASGCTDKSVTVEGEGEPVIRYLSPNELATVVGVKPCTIYRAIDLERLPHLRLSRINPADLAIFKLKDIS
jgi:excisionase family DNA binding protein